MGEGPQVLLRDGAAYDPRADAWRRIPRAPIPPQVSPDVEPDGTEAIWTGEVMVVWNGKQGAIYDPASNRWRRISPAGAGSLRRRSAAGTAMRRSGRVTPCSSGAAAVAATA